MTIEEKKQAIEQYCDSKRYCTCDQEYPCPLYEYDCELDRCNNDTVDTYFELVRAMPDYKGKTEDMEVWSVDKDIEIEKTLNELRKMDAVNHPSHYTQGGIECIDAMESAFGKEAVSNFCICNAFKYVWRTKQKNGIEDVDKAVWYLTKYKELSADEAI